MSQSVDRKRKQPSEDTSRRRKHIPLKKRKKAAAAYHSSSEEEDEIHVPQTANGSIDAADEIEFSSSGEEDEGGVTLPNLVPGKKPQQASTSKNNQESDDSEEDANHTAEGLVESDEEDDSEDDAADSEEADNSDAASSNTPRKIPKRKDASHFATSMSKILSSKLTTSKRADPVLSRSKDASITTKELNEGKLEAKARRKLRDEKRAALEHAREKDVTGVNREDVSAGAVAEKEKQLRKTAQRGVVKLFNAVRAAQVKGEETEREARMKGVVGADRRQEQVNEMSKKGFLDLLVDGGK